MFWGASAALDLFEEYKKYLPEGQNELNILLFGSSDPRHILKSLAKSYQHQIKINFYLLDGCMEIVARNMLLLLVATEQPSELSMKARTHIFMDIYGNSLLRPATYCYMISKSEHLIKMITDYDFAKKTVPFFNLSTLKYKERDLLECIFKFWQPSPKAVFEIQNHWDQRVRQLLGTRYDSANGAFDWDLQMKLKDYGGKQICPQEYKHWRATGVAFTFPEFEQSIPNKTLAAGVIKSGGQYGHRGYLGDITVGPFAAFGLTCPDIKLLESNHGTNVCRSTDITERNVFELMYEIIERKPYEHDAKNSHVYGSVTLDLSKQINNVSITHMPDDLKKFDKPALTIENITVTFLTIEDVLKLTEKNEYHDFFDIIWISHNYLNFIKNNFRSIFKTGSLVLFETKQFSVMRKDKISEELAKIKKCAGDLNLTSVTNYHINLPLPVAKYITKELQDEVKE